MKTPSNSEGSDFKPSLLPSPRTFRGTRSGLFSRLKRRFVCILGLGFFCLCAVSLDWGTPVAPAEGAALGPVVPPATTNGKKIPPVSEAEKKLEKEIEDLSSHDLYFEPESTILSIEDQEILLKDSDIMDKHHEIGIVLMGTTDERGRANYNAQLGLNRAKAVKDFLIDEGIDADRIVVVSFGKKAIPGYLMCAEHKERCWKKHRIVHVLGYLRQEKMHPFSSGQPTAVTPRPTPSVVTVKGEKVDEGIYMLPEAGQFIAENTMTYVHNSSIQVALQNFLLFPLLPGSSNINVQAVNDDYYIDTVSLYYGITHQLELEVDVPYVYRTEITDVSPLNSNGSLGTTTQANVAGSGLGDIQFGVHYQINTHKVDNGVYMAHLMVKSTTGSNPFSLPIDTSTGLLTVLPTGTGFWTIEPGISVYYPISPIVLYGNANFLYNFPQDFGGNVGIINPGNATDFNFGGWFSFSPKTMFTIGYDQMTVWPPSENGSQIPLTRMLQMGSVLFGTSYNANKHFFIMFNVAAGVTPDAPNVSVSLKIPLFY